MNEAYKDVRRLKMTLKTLEITWARACCPPYTDAMESKYNYQFTQKAEADLDDIILYIARELSNPKVASDFMNKLQKVIEETRTFPNSGTLVVNDFLPDKEIRKKLVGNYVLYYFANFEEKTIYILRVVYGRRNMDEILRQLDLKNS